MHLLAIDWHLVAIKSGQLILALSILVILHEFGHYITARWFGCRVEKFYLFFDPWFSIFKKKVGDTEYGVGWLPLGGYVKIAGMIDGTTKGGIPGIRNSQVSWIHPCKELDFLYRRLTDCIVSLNKQFFKFDLYGFVEGLQFTHYPAPGGKYGRHVDRIRNFAQRKLSCSIQLSDPETYKGGDFFLYEGELGTPLPKKQGTLIVFPSYILHEVKPVTEGERNSLVAWVSGPSFR